MCADPTFTVSSSKTMVQAQQAAMFRDVVRRPFTALGDSLLIAHSPNSMVLQAQSGDARPPFAMNLPASFFLRRCGACGGIAPNASSLQQVQS